MARTKNKGTLTDKLISGLRPKAQTYVYWDDKIQGLTIAVYPNGKKVFRLNYYFKGKQKSPKIGNFGVLNTSSARNAAIMLLGKVTNGIDIIEERKQRREQAERNENLKLSSFIENKYAPWVLENRKSGKETLKKLKSYFPQFMPKPMDEITPWQIMKWQSDLRKTGLKPATINRILTTLKATLSKAVEWNVLQQSPLSRVKNLHVEEDNRVRYLSALEERNIHNAFLVRHKNANQRRKRFNKWRTERGYPLLLEDTGLYIDHLEPIFHLAINTGMRRGEIFELQWDHINFEQRVLTVSASGTKSGKTRYIPLNDQAFQAILKWKSQSKGQGLVFPSPKTGMRLTNISKSWASLLKIAGIDDFRFHDLRHTFASKLVMVGVDLNTVRELLGHSNLDMTLRYAHLAPEHKAAAVALLITNSS